MTQNAPGLKRSQFRFRVKADEIAEDGTFAGYGSVFNVVDSYGDVVMPGAFAASLQRHAADASMPALLWQHLPEEPIGVWIEMREDEHGLWCKGRLLTDVTRGREALALLRAGALNGLSIGYEVLATEDDTGAIEEKLGALPEGAARYLSEIDLWEVSVVTFPACAPAKIDTVKDGSFVGASAARSAAARNLDAISAALSRRGAALRRFA